MRNDTIRLSYIYVSQKTERIYSQISTNGAQTVNKNSQTKSLDTDCTGSKVEMCVLFFDNSS